MECENANSFCSWLVLDYRFRNPESQVTILVNVLSGKNKLQMLDFVNGQLKHQNVPP